MGDNPAVRATSSSVGARGGLEFFTVDALVKNCRFMLALFIMILAIASVAQ